MTRMDRHQKKWDDKAVVLDREVDLVHKDSLRTGNIDRRLTQKNFLGKFSAMPASRLAVSKTSLNQDTASGRLKKL